MSTDFEDNAIAYADCDESRSAVRQLSDVERAANCGHTFVGRHGTCFDCGESME